MAEGESVSFKTACRPSSKESNAVDYNAEQDMGNSPIDGSYVSKRNSYNEPQLCSIAIQTECICQNHSLKTCIGQPINIVNNRSEQLSHDSDTDKLDQHVTFKGQLNRNLVTVKQDQNNSPGEYVTRIISAKRNTLSMALGNTDKTKRKRYNHRRTARMLFLCTVIYFVTWIPFWLDIFGFTHSIILRHVYLISHATNPIVYGIVNRQVRKSIKRLLCGLITILFFKDSARATSDLSLNQSISGTSAG
ncbi:hypothetical protein DPMN_178894 [Dreissena polymorpha]|uniref:G-protein coupled receptors family 1 profile domain-containing protein n=2 Tax=Dreissena polymorpha TaxID=45954 RepID=A0A9D4EE75_DREPO|nr:hypothetical protein DPMN_178894 [Dreissena polymorpha]